MLAKTTKKLLFTMTLKDRLNLFLFLKIHPIISLYILFSIKINIKTLERPKSIFIISIRKESCVLKPPFHTITFLLPDKNSGRKTLPLYR